MIDPTAASIRPTSPPRCASSRSCIGSTTSTPTSSPCATPPRRCSRPSSACAASRCAHAIADADRPSSPRTATGAPDRIDDETRGSRLCTRGTDAPIAGELLEAARLLHLQAAVHARRRVLPPALPELRAFSHGKRDARTDLTGKRALLTGGRAKIGMYIALRLLRDGAHTTITTRFPRDAVRRFAALPDSAEWLDRLRVVGIDLRDPAQVIGLADSVAAQGPLDILINNAAQTVRRSPGAYSPLAEAELAPLPDGPLPEMETFGHTDDAHPLGAAGLGRRHPILGRRGTRWRAER